MAAQLPAVGLIGLGAMGLGMAERGTPLRAVMLDRLRRQFGAAW